MRARALLLAGALLGLVATLVAVAASAAVSSSAEPGDATADVALVAGGATGVAGMAVVGFVAGWFGRERDDAMLVAAGLLAVGAVAVGLLALGSDARASSVAPVAALFAAGAVVAARATWRVADAICDFRGLPTSGQLVAPAFPKEVGGSLWTTEAGPALRRGLAALAEEVAPRQDVEARAVGIRLGLPRDHPVIAVLAGGRLAVQPVDLEGAPTGEPTVLAAPDLAEVSLRGEAADGSSRRHVNAYDDLIDVRTSSGDRLRLRLPYGTRGAGTEGGGPGAIRTWLRTSATTYR